MATPFTNSKIELHQWANSILLGVVSFFVIQTYNTISNDHEKLSNHETRITVLEDRKGRTSEVVKGNLDAVLEYGKKKDGEDN